MYIIAEAREVVSVETIRNGSFKIPEKKTLPAEPAYGSYGGLAPVADDGELPFL